MKTMQIQRAFAYNLKLQFQIGNANVGENRITLKKGAELRFKHFHVEIMCI